MIDKVTAISEAMKCVKSGDIIMIGGFTLSGSPKMCIRDSSGTSGGYISSMKTEAYGRIPVTASGSSSTYEADGLYYLSLIHISYQ